jgi:hypothetical protein
MYSDGDDLDAILGQSIDQSASTSLTPTPTGSNLPRSLLPQTIKLPRQERCATRARRSER